jgi:4-alpha-glucanotransferase
MPEVRLTLTDRRRAGVLLHLSSLGEGALGAAGRRFIDWLADAGFSVWQVLPVGPPGFDGSPYWLGSDFAGNPAFIDPAEAPEPRGPAWEAFLAEQAHWLEDYALFTVLQRAHPDSGWTGWPQALRERDPAALRRAGETYREAIEAVRVEQFAFHEQWRRLREHAHGRGVGLFGDLPIYVAPEGADTWAGRGQFRLDASGLPSVVAGVPPDYFSADGQLWGNPLYDWDIMRRDRFLHWRRRVAQQLRRFDLLRVDHFRGLAAHWVVPAGASTARDGHWQVTPGGELLDALAQDHPGLPLVAEDLGVITPDVEELRGRHGLPGMHVLQFGFDGSGDNPHLPHMHRHDSVVYTGTHDNDTLLGWERALDPGTRWRVGFYLRASPCEIPEAMLRAALGSVARLAVLTLQDLLGLGAEARFNTPGTTVGNWSWRLPVGVTDAALAERCLLLNRTYGRAG